MYKNSSNSAIHNSQMLEQPMNIHTGGINTVESYNETLCKNYQKYNYTDESLKHNRVEVARHKEKRHNSYNVPK